MKPLAERASQAVDEMLRTQIWIAGSYFEYDEAARAALAALEQSILNAEVFWWEPRIVDVLQASASTLPTWTVRPELFPAANAYCVLSRAITDPEQPGSVEGFAWSTSVSGQDLVVLTPLVRHKTAGELRPGHTLLVRMGVDVSETESRQRSLRFGMLSHRLTFEPSDPLSRFASRLIGAALLFLDQRLAVAENVHGDRASRRRVERADLTYPPLRVIRLRVPKTGGAPPHQSIDWQYRWLVRGHWRQQFYPTDASHRPLWIAPHIKGPADKPVKTPDASVFAVVR